MNATITFLNETNTPSLFLDVCRDTSDTDSYDTDGFATMDVIEYEVPSGSTSNSDLYSHDSSSGTDVR